ncbi:DnaA regulatory inactivator Hda [Methylotetracoccus oryzae]|uniref:DnaA regulatory inactivator Hda n=1 Tax=Methylotetracoccus oryzae TaxID=1919059 RepID=UPI001118E282|nr:DnaA regulatory inactivator Hda [Methylotetracoccus oryzae]
MAEQIPLALGFQPRATFDEYWPGANAEPVRHLEAIADGDGERFILLWGDEGSGKSHLLQATCRSAHRRGDSAAYLPLRLLRPLGAEIFEGLDDHALVCIDDLDAIAGQSEFEQGLFGLYNRLRDGNATLVVSAAGPPQQLDIGLPDLRSRLSWGLVLRLVPLDENDTLAAIALYARQLGLELSPQVSRFLLAHCRRDFTSLRHLLERLDRATLAAKRRLTIPFIKALLEELA